MSQAALPVGTYAQIQRAFTPDFFLKLKGVPVVLVVEIKQDSDDSNRNHAKLREGLRHFETLNARLAAWEEATRCHFKFLSPVDRPDFLKRSGITAFPAGNRD